MDPVTSTVTIDRPVTEVYYYLEDIANHAEFTDHYLEDFRLTREDSIGASVIPSGQSYRS